MTRKFKNPSYVGQTSGIETFRWNDADGTEHLGQRIWCCHPGGCDKFMRVETGQEYVGREPVKAAACALKWVFSTMGAHRCPQHRVRGRVEEKAESATQAVQAQAELPNLGEVAKIEPVMVVDEPTLVQKRYIFNILYKSYGDGRYLPGVTDYTVAETVGMPSRWVAKIRDEAFGPSGLGADFDALEAEIQATREEMVRVSKALAALSHKRDALMVGEAV